MSSAQPCRFRQLVESYLVFDLRAHQLDDPPQACRSQSPAIGRLRTPPQCMTVDQRSGQRLLNGIECGDHAIAEWKLTATQTVPYGSNSYRFPILVHGSTIAQTKNGKITRWSDYYDQNASRRDKLSELFSERIEY
jgi:hypothetical protein